MRRREFLLRSGKAGIIVVGAAALESLGGALSIGCGDSSDDTGGSGGMTFSVDPADGHVHTFDIPQATLDDPPAGGYTGTTSSNEGHTHSIALAQSELADIAAMMAVMGSTSFDSGHMHTFTFG